MMTKKILIIIVLLGFSLTSMDMGLWAGTADIPPGADVQQEKTEKKEEKKKEEAKNKKEKDKKLKRVWTDKDLKEIRKERLNITEVSPDPDEKKKKEKKKVLDPPDLVRDKTEGEKYDPKKTENYWRERKKALVDKIKENGVEIKKMEVKLFELQNQLNGADLYSERVRLEQEIRDTYNKLENYKKGLERMKKDLEDLHDEARKAGALPGWLRD